MATKTKSKRIFYFDILRATAILCVMIIHVTGFMSRVIHYSPEMLYSLTGFWELFSFNAFRIGVDLFLMLSGALSLGRDWEISDFLGKRLPRIIKPYVFWVIVGATFMIIMNWYFPQLVFMKDYSVMGILKAYYNSFMYKSHSFAAYWFFWMILGTYLIMPIFNKWLRHADLKEAEYFLAIWVVSTIFDYTLMMECPIKLSYFT
ncbi:acyltransferase, partial [uncultured Methanobrevibacter sp.]|uniref:acyltransferase n=1 Tax=uncultured Methanobrevibacter sp. TaxID=253161 RepID=UPI0025CDB8C3